MKRLVVVGNGMAGMACLEQILKYAPQFEVTVFGDETHVNYNRVMLSSVLAGEKAADDIVINGREWYEQHHIDLRVGVRVVDVDSEARTVTGNDGSVTPYDVLLLATGSNAFMPPIDGLDTLILSVRSPNRCISARIRGLLQPEKKQNDQLETRTERRRDCYCSCGHCDWNYWSS